MRGDRVEIVVAADDGSRTYEILATRAGRRVEITTGRGIVEVPYRANHHPKCLCLRCIRAKRRETDRYLKRLDMRDVD